MKQALIDVSLDLIPGLLQLPEGVVVEVVHTDIRNPRVVTLRISGEALPKDCEVSSGILLTKLNPQYRVEDDTVTFVGWRDDPMGLYAEVDLRKPQNDFEDLEEK